MNRISALIVLVVSVFLVSSTAALAADPTQADFDTCNRMAQSRTSDPSASPKITRARHQQREPTPLQSPVPR